LNPQAPAVALTRLREHVRGLFALEVPGGEAQQRSFGDLGVEIDKVRLAQLLRDSIDRTSPLARWRRREAAPGGAIDLPLPLHVNNARALQTLFALKDEYDRPAVDARLDLEKRSIIPSSDGLLLDVDASLRAIMQAVSQGATRATLVFEQLPPARRTEQLEGVRFDHVLASFETTYDRAERAQARTYNLRLAASRLDGSVLLPGEVFDFNRVVGPRDEASGYKVATVIAEGELVDGIGGGTCQVSGTLHGAAFLAGLEIVERSPHTRPSSYIKLGLDATVVYPTINYRFSNPFAFPIVLHEVVKDGLVRAEILGPESGQTVTLIRRIKEALPYEQVERDEPRLARGKTALIQRGVPGFKLRMYRILRHGPHARRQRWDMTYPATTQVIAKGTGTGTAAAVRSDPHPEYTADELFVLTLLPKGDAAPEVQESREAGPYGVAGWTARAGMPFYGERE
jgi:vancomycin resistance protein YoaR